MGQIKMTVASAMTSWFAVIQLFPAVIIYSDADSAVMLPPRAAYVEGSFKKVSSSESLCPHLVPTQSAVLRGEKKKKG